MANHVVGVTGGQFAHEGHGNEVDQQPDVTTRRRPQSSWRRTLARPRRLPSPADGNSCGAYAGSPAVLDLVLWVVPWAVLRGARPASRIAFQVTGKLITDKGFKMSKKSFGTD